MANTTKAQPSLWLPPRTVGRRQFLEGLAGGGVLLGAMPWIRPAWGQPGLTATGTPRMATTINGSIPGPVLRWREGDTVTLRVTNRLPGPTSLHWHGILLPFEMDGVPGISYPGIMPGETFVYRFPVRQSGTYWYHSHTGFQEQTGLYGALIIDPARGPTIRADRDYVVHLSEWTDEDPMRIFKKLKIESHYYNFNRMTAPGFWRDVEASGFGATREKRAMWNEMRMSPTDFADVSGYTYTYLLNGTTPAGNWTGAFSPGERVRLRFIGSGAQTFFDVRIPGLEMTVVHVDGQDVEPVTVDELRIGPAETYDVIVRPEDRPYTIFAQSMDRSGYARGTLSPRPGLEADIPAIDEPQWLTMADMMGAMAGGGMAGMDDASHGAQMSQAAADGTAMAPGAMDHAAMDHGAMAANARMVHARHARTEYGPSVDMRVDMPRTNLDDPGVGLRNNGRRVLTYADIRTIGGPLDSRMPGREIELHLTGNMERYSWSFDGLEFGRSTPVHFRRGERLRVVLVNDTMMTHPMHLHGLWSELEAPDGEFMARRHTIAVQPAQRVSFLVHADAPGGWAWHCHILYHMDAGMFREVVVS
jgi:CopA family copper-resistance protein